MGFKMASPTHIFCHTGIDCKYVIWIGNDLTKTLFQNSLNGWLWSKVEILLPEGGSCRISVGLAVLEVSWRVLERSCKDLWRILKDLKGSWRLMKGLERSWTWCRRILKDLEGSWRILKDLEGSWRILRDLKGSWRTAKFSKRWVDDRGWGGDIDGGREVIWFDFDFDIFQNRLHVTIYNIKLNNNMTFTT
jgi:hypothetical protein